MITTDSSRVVPVSEDLSTEELGLSVIRGNESMFRRDHKKVSGEEFLAGEWTVLTNGECARPSTTPVANTYLVLAGTDRFDVHASGKLTLCMNSNILVKSSRFNAGGAYVEGTLLTVKDLGAGEAQVTPASNGEFVFGKVTEVHDGYLVYEVFANTSKKS